jgi:dihydrodipicolinate synthase/N-acetylneuraminate lyase
MENKEDNELQNIALMTDILIKVTAMERLLVVKNIITNEELSKEINAISRIIAKSILKTAKVTGDLDKIIDDLVVGKVTTEEN